MKQKITPYLEYFAESTTACLITMVQGNVLALGVSHLLIASQTGVAAGAIAYIAILLAKTGRRWLISVILGLATGIVDYFVHPGMFGTVATEAVITGLGAAILSYLAGTTIQYLHPKTVRRNELHKGEQNMSIADLSSVLKIFGGSSASAESQEDLYKEVLLMTLARASRSDVNMHPVEIKTIQGIMQRETGQEFTEADIRKAARPELYESANLRKYLRSVKGQLNEDNKSTILKALADVIKSDTEISGLEVDYFNRVADALGASSAGLAGLDS